MTEEIIIDRFEPDYNTPCDNCGQVPPTVTATLNGKVVNHWEMCGPCVWGEASCIDPEEWN